MSKRLLFWLPLCVFLLTIWFVLEGKNQHAFISFFLLFGFIFCIVLFKSDIIREEAGIDSDTGLPVLKEPGLRSYTYYGDELSFSDADLTRILNKRFPYFAALSAPGQELFLKRLVRFMAAKSFRIFGDEAYREMPVLISASAIQLTFGLEKYLLPHFQFIHIYPREFMRTRPILCLLEGNVSGRVINLSWKHFLEGYEKPKDGKNLGLHEMAHALYYQSFVVEAHTDDNFRKHYGGYTEDANQAYHREKTIYGGLYSEYAEKNPQEFWAESMELFF